MKYSKELHEQMRCDLQEDSDNNAVFTYSAFECLLDEIERLQAERRWIPVSERLPKDSDCPIDSKGVPIPFVIGCINGALYGLIFAKHFQTDKYYTHWMPLPEPPKEEK